MRTNNTKNLFFWNLYIGVFNAGGKESATKLRALCMKKVDTKGRLPVLPRQEVSKWIRWVSGFLNHVSVLQGETRWCNSRLILKWTLRECTARFCGRFKKWCRSITLRKSSWLKIKHSGMQCSSLGYRWTMVVTCNGIRRIAPFLL